MLIFLLQSTPLEARANPFYLKVFFAILMFIFPIIIINQIVVFVKKFINSQREKNPNAFRLKFRTVKKACADFDFSPEQTKFFDQLCRVYNIKNPDFYLKNEDAADGLFKKIYHTLQSSTDTENSENAKQLIFSIRQQIENKRRVSRIITSTKSLLRSQKIAISSNDIDDAVCEVYENAPDGFSVSLPHDAHNVEIRLPLLSKVKVFLQSSTGVCYSFTSTVMRYNNKATSSSMVLAHNNKLEPLHSRTFKRIDLERMCRFCLVKITSNGKKTVFTPSSEYMKATVCDISGGGCRVKSYKPINAEQFINIELQIGKSADNIIGRVVGVRKDKSGREYTMHIQFVRMKKQTRNAIYSLIYNYI